MGGDGPWDGHAAPREGRDQCQLQAAAGAPGRVHGGAGGRGAHLRGQRGDDGRELRPPAGDPPGPRDGDQVRVLLKAREGRARLRRPRGCISTETRQVIEEEVKAILNAAYLRAQAILTTHEKELHDLARELLERETLSGPEIRKLLKLEPRTGAQPTFGS